MRRECGVPSCRREVHSQGFCQLHYMRWKRHGDPTTVLTARVPPWRERVIAGPNGCLIWQGRIDKDGYGRMGDTRKAHRVVYEAEVGPIPEGLGLDHTCHSEAVASGLCVGGRACPHRACVNPTHLEPVTPGQNTLRGATVSARNAAKTYCANGHPFDAANTYVWRGTRNCRACNRMAARRVLLRRKAVAR